MSEDTDIQGIVEFPGASAAMKAYVAVSKGLGISFSTVPPLRVEKFDKLVAGET